MKTVIARLNAITQSPIVFMVDSKRDSQIDAFIDGQIKRVGIEVYQHSQKLTREDAAKVAKVFAEHENIPLEEIHVRERLPKTQKEEVKHNRRANDANLRLVEKETNGQKQTLARAAQDLHDSETRGKSTPDNPEGATVKPQDAQPRKKRAYKKKTDKELSKRSQAALRQFHAELQKSAATQEPVEAPAPTVSQDEIDEQEVKMVAAIVKALRAMKDVA